MKEIATHRFVCTWCQMQEAVMLFDWNAGVLMQSCLPLSALHFCSVASFPMPRHSEDPARMECTCHVYGSARGA